MAAGSVIVIITSLTSSIGMSPITRIRLASSRVKASGILRFSPETRKSHINHTYMAASWSTASFKAQSRTRQAEHRPVRGSELLPSTFPTADTPLRPLGKAGEPDTAAGLITDRRQRRIHINAGQPGRNQEEKPH